MNILIILGTGRIGRQSEKVANFVLKEVKKAGHGAELADVRDYRIESTDRTGESGQAKKFTEKIKKTNALIIVSPEYNHSYPGELKMILDMLYDAYYGKPVAICGVSSGQFGGARMIEKLKLLCLELGMVPLTESVYFGNVMELFDEKEKIKKPEYHERVKRLVEKLDSAKKTKLKPGLCIVFAVRVHAKSVGQEPGLRQQAAGHFLKNR